MGGHGCLLLVRGAHRLHRGSINCLRSSQAQRGGSLLGYELDSGRFSPTNDLSRAAVSLLPERTSFLASWLYREDPVHRRAFRLLPPTSWKSPFSEGAEKPVDHAGNPTSPTSECNPMEPSQTRRRTPYSRGKRRPRQLASFFTPLWRLLHVGP